MLAGVDAQVGSLVYEKKGLKLQADEDGGGLVKNKVNLIKSKSKKLKLRIKNQEVYAIDRQVSNNVVLRDSLLYDFLQVNQQQDSNQS